MMKFKLVTASLALAAGSGLMVEAVAQVKPETLVKQRQAAMTLQGKYHYGQLMPMVRGRIPYDANVVARNAAYLDVLTQLAWDGFVPSTANVKSGALPEIYKEPAKFKEAQDRLRSEVQKLVATAKSGDEAAIKAQIQAVDKACGGCHESFRERQ
jgi:cytochrome c556